MGVGTRVGAFFLGIVLSMTLSCSSSSVSTQAELFAEADRLTRAGDLPAARSVLQRLSQTGSVAQRNQAGMMLCESGSRSYQRDCYKNLSDGLADQTHEAALADQYALALYRYFIFLDLDQRLTGFMKLALNCPGTPAGLKAVNYLKGYWESLAPAERLERWSSWQERVLDAPVSRCLADADGAQVIATVGLERARSYLGMNQAKLAATMLETIWPQIEESVWWDDVAILWAESLMKDSQSQRALEILGLFFERRESSFFIGSYESVHFDDALMMRGHIYRSLGAVEKAREAYLRLIASAPNSRLCDDAAYHAAQLLRSKEKLSALNQFIQDYPESKWVKWAQEELGR